MRHGFLASVNSGGEGPKAPGGRVRQEAAGAGREGFAAALTSLRPLERSMRAARMLLHEVAYATRLTKLAFPRYDYGHAPIHLCKLVGYLDETRDVPGDVLEIGCLAGSTTIFLNRHLQHRGVDKRYFAIDTFRGFVESDLEHESSRRAKSRRELTAKHFDVNKPRWFDRTMADNGIEGVVAVKGDINTIDLTFTDRVSFCLVDVDLYNPVASALRKVYPLLSPGGIVVVDDCVDQHLWDGAYHAYRDFCTANGLSPVIVEDKYGVVRKPR